MEYIIYECEKDIINCILIISIILSVLYAVSLYGIRKKARDNMIKYFGISTSLTVVAVCIIIRFLPVRVAIFFSTVIIYFVLVSAVFLFLIIKSGGFKADFNKDYIIILGCRINKEDGTVTNLLRSRIDKAVAFAKEQYDKTGKRITFVASGGQGKDEIISEGAAIRNYLIQNKIGKDNILVEDRSTNTFENLKFSMDLIRQQTGNSDVYIAYSTSDYHVYRTGKIAKKLGIKAEGMGAKTDFCYRISCTAKELMILLLDTKLLHISVFIFLLAFMTYAFCV